MTGAASLGVRSLIDGPRRPARVIAAFPVAVYLELSIPGPEPRVLALVTPGAVRLPNAVIVRRTARRTRPGWSCEPRRSRGARFAGRGRGGWRRLGG